jgi:hypothetical protein
MKFETLIRRKRHPVIMMTVTDLLSRAKRAIESGETALHAAAEDIAAAQEQGATQRRVRVDRPSVYAYLASLPQVYVTGKPVKAVSNA